MREVNCIVWHCSGTKDGKPVTREAIEASHKARGFRQIGYHWLIEPDGSRIKGRPEASQGAHVEGFNAKTIGICLIGSEKFTAAQWAEARKLAIELEGRYHKAAHRGHRDFSPDQNRNGTIEKFEWIKTCPGFDVKAWEDSGFIPKEEDIL